jgi:hypothetical protein
MAVVIGRIQRSPVPPAGRQARPISEPAPEYGPYAERVTFPADGIWLPEDRVVICLHREREFQSESPIMRWFRRDKTALHRPEELYAQYADQFRERREAARHNPDAWQRCRPPGEKL